MTYHLERVTECEHGKSGECGWLADDPAEWLASLGDGGDGKCPGGSRERVEAIPVKLAPIIVWRGSSLSGTWDKTDDPAEADAWLVVGGTNESRWLTAWTPRGGTDE